MAVRRAEGGFQLGEVLGTEKVVHPFPHPVAQLCPFGKGLPRTGQIFVPDGLHGVVQILRDLLGELLHPEAAVKGDDEQRRHNGETGVDAFS